MSDLELAAAIRETVRKLEELLMAAVAQDVHVQINSARGGFYSGDLTERSAPLTVSITKTLVNKL